MSKRREGESYEDYRERTRAESQKAKKRRGWVRWVSGGTYKHEHGFYAEAPGHGTYNKKNGEITDLFEEEEKATDYTLVRCIHADNCTHLDDCGAKTPHYKSDCEPCPWDKVAECVPVREEES